MKKKAVIFICIFISLLLFVGCSKEEVISSPEQDTVVEDSQSSKEEKPSIKTEITDEKVLKELAQFIDSFAALPAFDDVATIDKAWIVRKYHTETGFYDATLFKKYNQDTFSKMGDIEKLAKQNINPDIKMSEDDDFSSLDGTSRGNPLWIKEEKVFGWNASGGYSSLEKTYFIEAYKTEDKYFIKAIDLVLSFDDEYYLDTSPQGTIYATLAGEENSGQWVEVGTFTLDQDTNNASYNFTKELKSLKKYWYEVKPNSSNGFYLTAKQHVDEPKAEESKVDESEVKAPEKVGEDKKILSFEAATQLLQERVYDNNPDIGFVDFGKTQYKGEECYYIRSFSKEMREAGGSGTIELIYVEVNTGRIWIGDKEIRN